MESKQLVIGLTAGRTTDYPLSGARALKTAHKTSAHDERELCKKEGVQVGEQGLAQGSCPTGSLCWTPGSGG